MKLIQIFESYVGRGAPSNAAGSNRGYGLTKEEATQNAGHWANQAPWARTRKILISDLPKASSLTSREEKIAWDVCGIPGEFVPASPAQKKAAKLIGEGKYATAIEICLTKSGRVWG